MSAIITQNPSFNFNRNRNWYQVLMRILDHMLMYDPSIYDSDNLPLGGGILGAVGATIMGVLNSQIYRFRVNPTSISMAKEAIRTYEKTKGGHESYLWGQNMVPMNMTCTTAWMNAPQVLKNVGIDDYRFSMAKLSFDAYNDFFDKVQTDGTHVNMIWDMTLWRGHVNRMDWTRSADRMNIDYSFTFNAFPSSEGGIKPLRSVVPGMQAVLNTLAFGATFADDVSGGEGI